MTKTVISSFVLVMLSCTFFNIACHASNETEIVTIDKTASSVSNIVLRYIGEFRNFSQLQNAMEAIYEFRFKYNDTAKENIWRSYWLSTEVQNKYRDSVNTMDWGCEYVIENIPTNVTKRDMRPYERAIMLRAIIQGLYSGQYFARESLKSFKLISPKLVELRNSLDATSNDLHYNDSGSNGSFPGQQKQEILLNEQIANNSRVLNEKICTAREIAARFNGDLDDDGDILNAFSKISPFDGAISNKQLTSWVKNTTSQFQDQFYSKMRDLLNNCKEFRKWHASTSPRIT